MNERMIDLIAMGSVEVMVGLTAALVSLIVFVMFGRVKDEGDRLGCRIGTIVIGGVVAAMSCSFGVYKLLKVGLAHLCGVDMGAE